MILWRYTVYKKHDDDKNADQTREKLHALPQGSHDFTAECILGTTKMLESNWST